MLRGEAENRIKELKLELKGDRLSCHRFRANQFQLLPYHLQNPQLAPAQVNTLPLKLLKIRASVRETITFWGAGQAELAAAATGPRSAPGALPGWRPEAPPGWRCEVLSRLFPEASLRPIPSAPALHWASPGLDEAGV
ncbi:MAG: transposase [Syntrophales bacterium]|nr:transposase [Syntrophales bacterium]